MGLGPITAIIPRPVKIRLGSEDYKSGELRLCDLADLQQLIDDQIGDPLGHVRERLESEGVESVELDLADILESTEKPPKVYGEYRPASVEEAVQLRIMFVKACLQRYQPEISYISARRITALMLPGQFANLERIAWKTTVAEEVGRILGTKNRPSQGGGRNWPKAIVEVAKEFGYTLDYVYSLTLSEFWYCRSLGKELPENSFDISEAPKRQAWWRSIEEKRKQRKGRI